MVKTDNPGWAEGLQLVPIVTLAFPFIVRGEVDLSRAAGAFLIAAALTIPVTLAVLVRDHLLNPILVGTALWLWLGAVAFNVPADAAATWLTETQALGIFLFSLGVQSLFLGLLAEIGIRTYHESQNKPIYIVREVINARG